MRDMKTMLFKAIGFTVVVLSGITGLILIDYNAYLSKPLQIKDGTTTFTVSRGMSLRKIAYHLHKRKILKKPHYFIWYGKFSGRSSRIHVGEYELSKGDTPKKLLTLLASGKVKEYSITVIEGWTFKQMMAAINKHPSIKHTLQNLNNDQIMARLGFPGVHPEGRFLPETYKFPRNTTDTAFLKRAYNAMQKKLQTAWEKREKNLPIKSPYEALILASVVERETGVPSERPRIAGVFVRRLNKRMRLQSDPTVIYGMGDRYKGNIRSRDLRRDTPYNTYTRFGLPVTPIAMPSGKAIEAVLHPEPGKYLYFVARGDGSHKFSATLKEHSRAVRKYQIKNRKRNYTSRYNKSKNNGNKTNGKKKP